jgi:hypothetical protein
MEEASRRVPPLNSGGLLHFTASGQGSTVGTDAVRVAVSPRPPPFGLEVELGGRTISPGTIESEYSGGLNLTDEAGDPALVNAAALEAIADPSFQTDTLASGRM